MSVLSSVRAAIPYADRQKIKALPGVLALQFMLVKRDARSQLVTRESQFCIEGFPRSGNGFSYLCARDVLNVPDARIAHHTHSPANIKRAIDRGVPAFLLTRNPRDACLSLIMYGACSTLEDALSAYEAFYAPLIRVRRQVICVPFEELVSTPQIYVTRLAAALGRDAPVWDEAAARQVDATMLEADRLRHGANVLRTNRPHPAKEQEKKVLEAQLLTPRVARLLDRCEALRAELLRP